MKVINREVRSKTFSGFLVGVCAVIGGTLTVAAAIDRALYEGHRTVKKLHQGPDLVTGAGKLVGRQAVVTEELTAHHPGRIKLGAVPVIYIASHGRVSHGRGRLR